MRNFQSVRQLKYSMDLKYYEGYDLRYFFKWVDRTFINLEYLIIDQKMADFRFYTHNHGINLSNFKKLK